MRFRLCIFDTCQREVMNCRKYLYDPNEIRTKFHRVFSLNNLCLVVRCLLLIFTKTYIKLRVIFNKYQLESH
jgi:hypothetical protein